MENQDKFLTPHASRCKKNSLSQTKNDQYDDFFNKLGTYVEVNHIPSKRPSICMVNNDDVDNDLISSIYNTPKVKIGDANIDKLNHKFQQNLLKKSTPKLNKSQQNALCERLSSPRISKTVIDPQFKKEKPKKTYAMHEYNKEYINSRFTEIEEIITLSKLESILQDFCIIDNHVQEKPLISQNIFPLCQVNNSKNCFSFDSKLLKDALIQSFSKSSENCFWREISNCIKSSRMNRKNRMHSNGMITSEKKKALVYKANDENVSNNVQLLNSKNESDISYTSNISEMVCLNQVFEKKESNESLDDDGSEVQLSNNDCVKPEDAGPQKLKFALITDHFSETMIDTDFQCPNVVNNSQAVTNINGNIMITQIKNENNNKKEDQHIVDESKEENNAPSGEKTKNIEKPIENEQKGSIKIQIEDENYTEVDYNSESDEQIDDENANIKDLILEIRNKSLNDQAYKKIINDSSKCVFEFSSYNSLEFESDAIQNKGTKKKVIPTKVGNKKTNYPRFYDNLATLKRRENRDENSIDQTKKKTGQCLRKSLYNSCSSGKNERNS